MSLGFSEGYLYVECLGILKKNVKIIVDPSGSPSSNFHNHPPAPRHYF